MTFSFGHPPEWEFCDPNSLPGLMMDVGFLMVVALWQLRRPFEPFLND